MFYPGASSCTLWMGCLRAVSHTCSAVPQVPRGETVLFRSNKTHVSFSLAVGWGQAYCLITHTPPCQRQTAEDVLDPFSLPTPLPTKLRCCREKRERKREKMVINLPELDQASAQTKVKQACSKPLKDRIYIVITVMETDLYNFYTA